MILSNVGRAILASALLFAAAFAMPEPTQRFAVAADNWSPAPTAAPQFNILGRDALQANEGNNTCGFVSGLSASPVSCPNSKDTCATNTYFGVHGCCDPSALSACTIATTCIASTAMSSLCKDSSCSSDAAIAKCTQSTAAECYKWLFVYGTTTMTQHGCTSSGFTSTAQRTYGPLTTPTVFVTVTATTSPTDTSTPSTNTSGSKKQSIGPIVGGTVGGCTVLSLVALAAFVIHRRRVKARSSQLPPPSMFTHNSPEFDPNGFPTAVGWTEHDIKNWQQTGSVHRHHAPHLGVSEVHGDDRAVEVEAPEKTKSGSWYAPGQQPVEVEAQEQIRDEKKRWWKAPVEAPT